MQLISIQACGFTADEPLGAVGAEQTMDCVRQSRFPDFAGGDYPEGLTVSEKGERRENAGFEDARHVFPCTGAVGGRASCQFRALRLQCGDEGMVGVACYQEGVVVG